MLTIDLISLNGRNEGAVAHLKAGYWMIGRHRECQIRPKSSSVAERHCLIHVQENLAGVVDLESGEGTKVNEQELESKTWHKLADGDEIGCGKIRFRVVIHANVPANRPDSEKRESNVPADAKSEEVALTSALPDLIAQSTGAGEAGSSTAWFEKEIAGELGEQQSDAQQEIDDLVVESSVAVEDEVDLFNDDTVVADDDPTPVEPDRKDKKAKRKKKKKKQPALAKPKIPKSKQPRSLPSFSFGDTDNLKLAAAAVAALLFIGFFVYQINSSFKPAEIELRQGLD